MPEREVREGNGRAEPAVRFRGDNLSLLYQGIITAVVRVRSGEKPIGDVLSFRKNILDMKAEVEQEAYRLRYEKSHVEDATFAVVAYVDESIFSSNDPARNNWPALQAELFGKAVGGEDVFKRLDALNSHPNSLQLADILEVYLLCFLLGYQGRYGKVAPGELRRVALDLQARIDLIRGSVERFSPDGILASSAPVPIITGDRTAARLRWAFLGSILLVAILWIWFRVHLASQASDLAKSLSLGL